MCGLHAIRSAVDGGFDGLDVYGLSKSMAAVSRCLQDPDRFRFSDT